MDFHNILVAIDFKEAKQTIVQHALKIAKMHNARLTFIAVVSGASIKEQLGLSVPQENDDAKQKHRLHELNVFVEQALVLSIESSCLCLIGDPATKIIKQVIRNEHDLLIIAERKTHQKSHQLMGNTARELLRKTPCPVWAIHPDHSGSFKHVMATIDVSKPEGQNNEHLNDRIVRSASSTAIEDQADLSLLSIPSSDADIPVCLERQNGCLQRNDIVIEDDMKLLQLGHVPDVIVDASKKNGIDLLVMGMLSHSGIKGFFIGNTIEKVMDDVECSILAIKPAEFVSPVTLDEDVLYESGVELIP